MTRALLILVLLALIVVVGLSFVGGETSDARREAVAPADQPGYFLTGATITDTAQDGSPRIRIHAARIMQIPAENSVALAAVRLTYSSPEDHDWLVTADRGLVPETSKIVHLDGNVRIRGTLSATSPEAVIETQSLDYNTELSTAQTNEDVTIVMGTRTLTARGLNADLKQRVLRLESRVHGQFTAPPAR